MKQIFNIINKELNTFFDSLMGYILMIMFLGFAGFFTWVYGDDIFLIGQASLDNFFTISYWSLFFFIPALTMRSIAGELKAGTLELLLTKPISYWEIILGKFGSYFLLICICLLPTSLYYFTLMSIGPIDHSAVIFAYLGLLLMSSVYISLGLLTSSLTSNPIIAYLFSLFIGLFLHVVFGFISSGLINNLGGILHYMSLYTHYESMARGVLDLADLFYFISISVFALYVTRLMIAKK